MSRRLAALLAATAVAGFAVSVKPKARGRTTKVKFSAGDGIAQAGAVAKVKAR